MTHTSEYSGYQITVTSNEDSILKTWTAAALIRLSEHNTTGVAELDPASDGGLLKSFSSEEEAARAALQVAHNRINRSNAIRGISK